MTEKNQIIKEIQAGETSLGIEFGSTRIKAVLIGKNHAPIASGSYEWENQLADGIWTYSLEDIWKGLQTSYQELAKRCQRTVRRNTDQDRFHGIQCDDARLHAIWQRG